MRFFSASASPKERAKVIVPVVFLIFTLVAAGFLADTVSENRAREQLLEAMTRATTIRLEGRTLDQSSSILAVLKSLHHIPPHHSGPTNPLRLELVTGDRVSVITIARDSDTPGEYWVFRPGRNWYNNPLGQEAGRVTNPSLDTLLPWPRR